MVGYNLIHNVSGLETVLIIVVLPMMALATIVVLLKIFCEDWFYKEKPIHNYGRANTNWGKLTDPYYREEKAVNGIPVLYYKKVGEEYKATITNTIECPVSIDWKGDKFKWLWIAELTQHGWKQENPPAKPTVIASDDMWQHIDRILSAKAGLKAGSVKTKEVFKAAQITTKQSKTV